MNPDILFTIAAVPAALFVGLSKGGLPVVGMLAVPVLALVIHPIEAAGLLLPIYVVSDLFGLYAYRREFDRRNLLILIPGCTIGIGIGWATASIIPEPAVTLLVGLLGLFYCIEQFVNRAKSSAPREADWPRGILFGALAGFASFVSHSGGSPYQMYVLPQKLEKMVYAGTTTILFAFVNAFKLVPYWALGQISLENLENTAWLIPVAVAGTFVGVWLTRLVPGKLFFRLVMGALFLVSIKLTWDGVQGLL